MSSIRVLRKNFGIYVISNVLNAAVPFLLLPFLTAYLTPSEYGLVAMFQVLMNGLLPFFGLSLNSSISRQYFDRDNSDFHAYVSNALIVLGISTLVFGLLFIASGEYIEKYSEFPNEWLWTVVLFTFFQVFSEVLLTIWRVEHKAVKFGVFRILRTGLDMGLSLFFVIVLKRSWEGRIEGQLAAYAFFAILTLFYLYRAGFLKGKFNKEHIISVLVFGFPLIPHVLGSIVITYSDRLFITNMVGMREMGLYAVGYQVGMIIGLLQNSFNQAWQPWLFGKIKDDREEDKIQIVRFTYLYFAVILVISAVVALSAKLIIDVLAADEYQGAVPFVGWIAFGFAFNGMYKMVVNYLFYFKKTKFIGGATLITALINLLLNYLLIEENGPVGAAQATLISFFIQFVFIWLISARVYKMPWNRLSILFKKQI